MRLETLILSTLIHNESYLRQTIPHLKAEYFIDWAEKIIFERIRDFSQEYNAPPTKEALTITLEAQNVTEDEQVRLQEVVNGLEKTESNADWLLKETEDWCKRRAIHGGIQKSIKIMQGLEPTLKENAIPSILQDALSVCFDNAVGHDYLEDADSRFEHYHKIEARIPFDLDMFNKITRGGLPKKTLNVALAGTGVGKTMFMTHVASGCLSAGKNVLYITMEMSGEEISKRIDANLMNVTMEDLLDLPKVMFDERIAKIKKKTTGKILVKEYPTASVHSGHFRALLNEAKMKKDFVPDIIFIDYINICTSARMKSGGDNSYGFIKAIAEELRGLAVEFNVPILTATQTNRDGFSSSDVELTQTAESFGLPATADFMFALISTEDLEKLGQMLVKQLKNRYNDTNFHKRFMVGIDRNKMRLFDLDPSAQKNIVSDTDGEPSYKSESVTSRAWSKKNLGQIKV